MEHVLALLCMTHSQETAIWQIIYISRQQFKPNVNLPALRGLGHSAQEEISFMYTHHHWFWVDSSISKDNFMTLHGHASVTFRHTPSQLEPAGLFMGQTIHLPPQHSSTTIGDVQEACQQRRYVTPNSIQKPSQVRVSSDTTKHACVTSNDVKARSCL